MIFVPQKSKVEIASFYFSNTLISQNSMLFKLLHSKTKCLASANSVLQKIDTLNKTKKGWGCMGWMRLKKTEKQRMMDWKGTGIQRAGGHKRTGMSRTRTGYLFVIYCNCIS